MEYPSIDFLRADLVPHREWAIRRWFYAHPIWYYHRRSGAHEIFMSGKFFQLVDPELRVVCHLLNNAGVRTTPSCQGHSYPRERFERIWKELRKEEAQIREAGLVVKDCENDEAYLFRESKYAMPWADFETFHSEVSSHQNRGYLGMIVPDGLIGLACQLEEVDAGASCKIGRDEELGEILGGILLSVQVSATDEPVRCSAWRRFTDEVCRVLESH